MREPILLVRTSQIAQSDIAGKCHLGLPILPYRNLGEALRQRSPNFIRNLLGGLRSIDQINSFWFLAREPTIRFTNLLVEFGRLLFHPIRRRRWSNASQHSCPRCRRIHIKKKRHVRHAIADGKRIQLHDHVSIEFSRDALINCRRIKKTIGDDANATFKRRPDCFPNELTSARFEEKQFGFGSHAGTVGRKLQQVLDCLPNGSAARFTRDEQGNTGPLEPFRE